MKKKTPKQKKKNTQKQDRKKTEKIEFLYGPFADWKKPDEYPDPQKSEKKGPDLWAWQFLRRNPEYQKAFKEIAKLPPPSPWLPFHDLGKPNPGESKTDFLKRIDLMNHEIRGEQLFNLDSLYEWGTLCNKFGISRPVNPKVNNPFDSCKSKKSKKINVNDPSASSPPLDFCPRLDLRKPMELIQGTMGLILLDLNEPVHRNLEKVKELLEDAEALLDDEKKEKKIKEIIESKGPRQGEIARIITTYKSARKLKKTDRRIPLESFVAYLRLLDAEAAGVRKKDMNCLFPDHDEPEKAVFRGLNEARKWRDECYHLFRKEMACIFAHPQLPEALYTLRSSYKSR